MNNLNEAWEELLNPGDWDIYTLHNYPIPEDYHFVTLNSKFISNPDEREFKRALSDYCLMNSENLSKANYSLIIGREREGFRFQTAYNGTWEEVDSFENKLALERVCGSTDWSELSEQKIKLLEVISYLEEEVAHNWGKHAEALTGILHWMDYIQDFAVDKALLDEKIVFPGLERDEPTATIDPTKNYEVRDHSGLIGYIKSGDMFQERLHQLIENDRDIDEFDVDDVIPNAYTRGYKVKITVNDLKDELQLIPITIY